MSIQYANLNSLGRRTKAPLSKRQRWVVGVSLMGLLLFGQGIYDQFRLLLRERQVDRQLAQVADERAHLIEEEKRLDTNPAYVEGLIRSTFKVSQPGEYVIALPNGPSSDETR